DVGAVMTTREQSTFFYSALPEHHLRRDSSIFWSQIIFPRFPTPLTPVDHTTELSELIRREADWLSRGDGGRTICITGPRGAGATRAMFEGLARRTEYQVVRARTLGDPADPFRPLTSLMAALFPHHVHPKFSWEEQLRHVTGLPPDQWGTLRIFLKSGVQYVDNFGSDRDLRLSQELGLVLTALANDFPMVIRWDHCERYDERLISILMRLLPRLQSAPIMNICTGCYTPGTTTVPPHWGALRRGLLRQTSKVFEVTLEAPEAQHLKRLLAYFVSDEEDFKFLLRKVLTSQFDSYHTFLTWIAYWKETLFRERVARARARLFPGEYNALKDPLFDGSLPQLYAGRWQHCDATQRTLLWHMAHDGIFFALPTRKVLGPDVNELALTRHLVDLERRWHITIYREHGNFQNPGFAEWLQHQPMPR
ncbi:MAG: hypothetical protein ABI743_11095, partial [bacterium]